MTFHDSDQIPHYGPRSAVDENDQPAGPNGLRRRPLRGARGIARRSFYDIDAVAASRFTPNISQTGAEGDVFDANARGKIVAPDFCHFPWDVAHLSYSLSVVSSLFEHVPRDRLKFQRLPDGDIEYRHPLGTGGSRAIYRCRAMDAYHVGEVQVGEDGRVGHRFHCVWAQAGDVWFVKSMREELNRPKHSEHWEMEYMSFEPNVEIDPKLFTLDALDLPGGARLIDRRGPQQALEKAVHYVPVPDKKVEATVKELVKEVAKLPTRPTRSVRPGPAMANPQDRATWYGLMIANAAILILAIGWARHRRNAQAKNADSGIAQK